MANSKKVPKEVDRSDLPPQADEAVGTTVGVKEVDGDYSVEIVRDYYGAVDPFYLSKKDPNYVYRFLRDDVKNLSAKTGNLLFQKGGWQIVPKSHLLKLGLKADDPGFAPDGLFRKGDTILAFMPKKLYEEKNAYKAERAEAPMKQIKRLIKDGDPNQGGKDIHESMRGIQTQKQLGM